MTQRDEIIAFCDDLLGASAFADYGPNGLQVPGRRDVRRVATCVSAHLESIQGAIDAGAEILIAHHGLFWDFHPRALSEAMASRLRLALAAELSVAGYHLPLDAHREIGNNALLCERLGLEPSGLAFSEVKGTPIGIVGRAPEGMDAGAFVARVEAAVERRPLVLGSPPAEIRDVGIVSGAGAASIHEAARLGLDAVVTGEPAEHALADAKEAGILFVAAGHYATETFGIRRLGELIADRFGVEQVFLDFPNPV